MIMPISRYKPPKSAVLRRTAAPRQDPVERKRPRPLPLYLIIHTLRLKGKAKARNLHKLSANYGRRERFCPASPRHLRAKIETKHQFLLHMRRKNCIMKNVSVSSFFLPPRGALDAVLHRAAFFPVPNAAVSPADLGKRKNTPVLVRPRENRIQENTFQKHISEGSSCV